MTADGEAYQRRHSQLYSSVCEWRGISVNHHTVRIVTNVPPASQLRSSRVND